MATPKLTHAILADDAATAARIDQLVDADGRYGRHVRAILNAQNALRGVLSHREWRVYLDLESVTNARFSYALFVVATWAFEQGRLRPGAPTVP